MVSKEANANKISTERKAEHEQAGKHLGNGQRNGSKIVATGGMLPRLLLYLQKGFLRASQTCDLQIMHSWMPQVLRRNGKLRMQMPTNAMPTLLWNWLILLQYSAQRQACLTHTDLSMPIAGREVR